MKSIRGQPSRSRTSKFTTGGPELQQYCVRHSILKIRLGAEPLTDVKMPWPLPESRVYKSVQPGAIKLLAELSGTQTVQQLSPEVKYRFPFEYTTALVKTWS